MNLFKINLVSHRLFGLIAGLHFALLGFSGAYLAYGDFFEKLLFSGRYHIKKERGEISVTKLVTETQELTGYDSTPTKIEIPENKMESIQVTYKKPIEGERPVSEILYYDPVEKISLGQVSFLGTLKGFLFMFHHEMFLGGTGHTIMGVSGVLIMIILLTGIYLWWPKKGRWKQAFTQWRTKKFLTFTLDGHKLLGIYTSVLMIMVSFTGLYTSVPSWFQFGQEEKRRGPPPGKRGGYPSFDLLKAYALAEEEFNFNEGGTLFFHPKAKKLFIIQKGQRSTYLPEKNIFQKPNLSEGPEQGDRPKKEEGFNARRLFKDLHVGHYWGQIGIFLAFVAGVLAMLFYISGIYLWIKKSKMRLFKA